LELLAAQAATVRGLRPLFMKILFLTIHSGVKGKANLDIFNTAEELVRRNHAVYLATRNDLDSDRASEAADSKGVRVVPIGFHSALQSFILLPWFLWRVKRLVNDVKPDIIISENNLHCPFIGALVACLGHRPHLVLFRELTADALYYDSSRSWLKRLLAFPMMKASHWLFRRLKHKLAVNQGISQYYGRVLGERIPHVWLMAFPALESRDAGRIIEKGLSDIANDRLNLVYSGSLSRERGVGVLLRSVAELPDKGAVHLYITGSGKDKSGLVKLSERLGIAEHVTFSDWLSEAELNALLRRMDVGIEPYDRPWPQNHTPSTKLAKYRAMGLFVIATRAPGYAELLKEPGTGFTYGSDSELSKLIWRCVQVKQNHGTLAFQMNPELKMLNIKYAVDKLENILFDIL